MVNDPVPQIGQRWMWNNGFDKAIVEVIRRDRDNNYCAQVIQIISGSSICGSNLGSSIFPIWDLSSWQYLKGQDRPL